MSDSKKFSKANLRKYTSFLLVGVLIFVILFLQLKDFLKENAEQTKLIYDSRDSLVSVVLGYRASSDSMKNRLINLENEKQKLTKIEERLKKDTIHTQKLIDTLKRALEAKDEELQKIYKQMSPDSAKYFLAFLEKERRKLAGIEEQYKRDKRNTQELIDTLKKALQVKDEQLRMIYTSRIEQDSTHAYSVSSRIVQPASGVTLSGTIVDAENRRPLPNVVVNISDRFGSAFSFNQVTDKNGFYSARISVDVNQGRAIINITHKGYKPVEYNAWVGSNRTLDFSLSRE